MKFPVQKLYSLQLLTGPSSLSFLKSLVYDVENKDCNYGDCNKCQLKDVILEENNNPTWYFKWQTNQISRLGVKDLTYNIKITSKDKVICDVNNFVKEVNLSIPQYLRYMHNTGHQFKAIENKLKNLKQNEISIVIDFMQNDICECSNEIQSAHFGASNKQLFLHTGTFYYKKESSGKIVCNSFYTVSVSSSRCCISVDV